MKQIRGEVVFEAIAIEGGILTPDFLGKVSELAAPRQAPADYSVPRGIQIRDEIGRAWRIAQAHWQDVETALKASGNVRAPMNTMLRNAFGWLSLVECPQALTLNEQSYPVTALALEGTVPIVIGNAFDDLDKGDATFGDGQKRRSVFGLVQDYLNASKECVWGIATNGFVLRITRDNASLTRPAWIEADIGRIMREERYADFSLLWLLLHESRFGTSSNLGFDCPLEEWRASSMAVGTVARDRLRDGVEEALRELGNGFLANPRNDALRARLQSGELDPAGYMQQLLRLVYRLIFLLVAEERDLLHPEESNIVARDLYRDGYSLGRLRGRASRRRAYDRHEDAWLSLKIVLRACAVGEPRLAIAPLGGLFAEQQTPDLDHAHIANRFLFSAVYRLTWLENRDIIVRVNWRDMGTEELGSVYESLLELVPVVDDEATRLRFVGDPGEGESAVGRPTRGHARKLTGSYYTPDSLVQALLDSALDPIAQRAEADGDPERAILALAVLDPACGSGHFLLGAARRLASRLARVRSEGTPSPTAYRAALRDVVTHCVYGVDKNAMAIELARIALWLEAIDPGRPLAFLDHHIVHGDALLGLIQPFFLANGIPDAAFSAVTGDDKKVAKVLKRQNSQARKTLDKEQRTGQLSMSFRSEEWIHRLEQIDAMPDGSLSEIADKEAAFRTAFESDSNYWRFAQNAYTAAFMLRKTELTKGSIPTSGTLRDLAAGLEPPNSTIEAVNRVSRSTPFLQWSIAFAPVMARGGFDCILGNPPWEKVALSDREFFASSAPEIANAPNGAARANLIQSLSDADEGTPEFRLFADYMEAGHHSDAFNQFAHQSARFPLTGTGIVNLYALFAETALQAIRSDGRIGLVLPSGIASDAGTAAFFREISKGRIVSLIDFENRRKLFSAVDSRQKFCLLTIGQCTSPSFAFFLTDPAQRSDEDRLFTLAPEDLARVNPNTLTAPIFRSRMDAQLTTAIYRRVPVLWNESHADGNAWSVSFRQGLFNMTGDSDLFMNEPGMGLLRLYEAKMIHQFDHRFATYVAQGEESARDVTVEEKANPNFVVRPRYWVSEAEVELRLGEQGWNNDWLLCWRNITNATNERTVIAAVIPRVGVGHSAPLIGSSTQGAQGMACLLANLNSLVLDYVARQKVGGTNLTYSFLKQFPVFTPSHYDESAREFIVSRVLELTYNAIDMLGWANGCGFDGPPFSTGNDRRAILRAELDAWYAHSYGLTRDDLRFILDPADAVGPDYPSETFRVLKETEERTLGEYRTRRLVLEAWDRLIGST